MNKCFEIKMKKFAEAISEENSKSDKKGMCCGMKAKDEEAKKEKSDDENCKD